MQHDVNCDVCDWSGQYADLDLELRGEPRCPSCLSDELNYREDEDDDGAI